MMLRLELLLALVALLALGCTTPRRGNTSDDDDVSDDDDSSTDDDDSSTDDDDDSSSDDDDAVEIDVIITDASPAPGDDNHFFMASPWVRFDRVPNSALLSLRDAYGTELASTDTVDGTLMVLELPSPLTPSTAYDLVVDWSPCNGCPTTISFDTGPYGTPVADPEGTLIGQTYNLDLSQADFVEPPGVGPILQSQIGDIAILFSIQPESNFDAPQPGLQILGAFGAVIDPVNGIIEQEACTETLDFTAGLDGVIGTADDSPGTWNNPSVEFGPTNLDMRIQGLATTIQDFIVTGTFHPEGDDTRGGTFSGRIDTRPLAPELDPEGGEDAVCNLVWETIGVECEPCYDDGSEPFCLSVLAENIVSERIDGLALMPMTCETIIDMYVADPWLCDSEATDLDQDADGVYEGCNDYTP